MLGSMLGVDEPTLCAGCSPTEEGQW